MSRRKILGFDVITYKQFGMLVKHYVVNQPKVVIPVMSMMTYYATEPITYQEHILPDAAVTKNAGLETLISDQIIALYKDDKGILRTNLLTLMHHAQHILFIEGHNPTHLVRLGPRRYAMLELDHFTFYRTPFVFESSMNIMTGHGKLITTKKNNVVILEIAK